MELHKITKNILHNKQPTQVSSKKAGRIPPFYPRGFRQWVYVRTSHCLSSFSGPDKTAFISFEIALENQFLKHGHKTHLDTFDTDYDLTACATCSCASDGFCINLTALLQLHCHTLHVH